MSITGLMSRVFKPAKEFNNNYYITVSSNREQKLLLLILRSLSCYSVAVLNMPKLNLVDRHCDFIVQQIVFMIRY